MSLFQPIKPIFCVLCFLFGSCALRYNSIQYIRSDKDKILEIGKKSTRQRFEDNVMFVHADTQIVQLDKVVFSTKPEMKQITGIIVETDSMYSNIYEYLKGDAQGAVSIKFLNRNDLYMRQTHVFVDSMSNINDTVHIYEQDIENVLLYYV